jgi:predicted nucleotidyltransferase
MREMSLPAIDLLPGEWEIVRDLLRRHLPEREVWAFGSRARQTAKPFSDLDLAILGNQPLTLATLANVAEDFSESDLPFKVDIVDWATTSERFRKIIESEHIVLQNPQTEKQSEGSRGCDDERGNSRQDRRS